MPFSALIQMLILKSWNKFTILNTEDKILEGQVVQLIWQSQILIWEELGPNFKEIIVRVQLVKGFRVLEDILHHKGVQVKEL